VTPRELWSFEGVAAPATLETPQSNGNGAFAEDERAAVYRAIHERRDVRTGFRRDPVPDDVLTRVLAAAHTAPSVGFSQPWDFLVLRSPETRTRVQRLAAGQRARYGAALPSSRAKAFAGIKT
jgi:nicotinate-nucleotide--dimethylbenzimidazole phosphoribosyltransferase